MRTHLAYLFHHFYFDFPKTILFHSLYNHTISLQEDFDSSQTWLEGISEGLA